MEQKNAIGKKDEDGEDLIYFCPKENCGEKLSYFSGDMGIPEYNYCRKCMDKAYDIFTGEVIGRIE